MKKACAIGLFLATMILETASAASCVEPIANESDLDLALGRSAYAFVAHVTVDDESDPSILHFTTYEPSLKGDVPKSGALTYVSKLAICNRIDLLWGEGIIVLFLTSLDEIVTNGNATLLSLADDGPSYRWVSDWLQKNSPASTHE